MNNFDDNDDYYNIDKGELYAALNGYKPENNGYGGNENKPKIGIFWLYVNSGNIEIFYSRKKSVEYGQKYGSFIVDPDGHYNIWELIKENKIFPGNSNYEDLPRGRVAYNTETKQFFIYHGNYINSSNEIKSLIKTEFNLKNNVKWVPDLHYNNFKSWKSRILNMDGIKYDEKWTNRTKHFKNIIDFKLNDDTEPAYLKSYPDELSFWYWYGSYRKNLKYFVPKPVEEDKIDLTWFSNSFSNAEIYANYKQTKGFMYLLRESNGLIIWNPASDNDWITLVIKLPHLNNPTIRQYFLEEDWLKHNSYLKKYNLQRNVLLNYIYSLGYNGVINFLENKENHILGLFSNSLHYFTLLRAYSWDEKRNAWVNQNNAEDIKKSSRKSR